MAEQSPQSNFALSAKVWGKQILNKANSNINKKIVSSSESFMETGLTHRTLFIAQFLVQAPGRSPLFQLRMHVSLLLANCDRVKST